MTRDGNAPPQSITTSFQDSARARLRTISGICWILHKCESARAGLELPRESSGKTHIPIRGGAESGALDASDIPVDPELKHLIDVWPNLPNVIRAGILAMIDAAKAGGSEESLRSLDVKTTRR